MLQLLKMNSPVADAGFLKGGSRKGSERKARAEILATPPQQLVIDTWTTTEHVHTNAASAILCQVHMQLSASICMQETF